MKTHRTPFTRILSCILACGLSLCVAASAAWAQPDLAAAGKAFAEAQRAELAGDFSQAASLYELADSIAPSPEALRGALKSRRQSGDHAAAATHALSLQRRHATHEPSQKLAKQTLDALQPSLVLFEVVCSPAPCTLQADGRALGTTALTKHYFFLEPGARELTAFFGSRKAPPQSVSKTGGEKVVVQFEEPANAPAPAGEAYDELDGPAPATPAPQAADTADSSEGGLSPAFFIVGAIATVGLGGLTIWSGVDTLDKKKDYEAAPTEEGFNKGVDLELRTNLLIAGTSVVGVATIVVAIFTDWGDGDELEPAETAGVAVPEFQAGPTSFSITWTGRF